MSINSISVSPKEIVLSKDHSFNGTIVTAFPDGTTNQSIIWESKDNSIASVDNMGKITGRTDKIRSVSITAKLSSDNNIKDNILVTIRNTGETTLVESIILNKTSLSLNIGDSNVLIAAINPTNASYKSISWHSSNANVVTVNSSGMVTAIGIGSAVITAIARDGSGVYSSCRVTVINNTIPAIRATTNCYVRTDTVISPNTILKDENGSYVILNPNDAELVPLIEKITVDNKDWYKVLYHSMVTYVTADSFVETVMPIPTITGVRDVLINTSSIDVAVRSTPFVYNSDSNKNLLGRFPHLSVIRLMNTTPQNGNWYAVYGKTANGTYQYGWTSGSYLDEFSVVNDNNLSQTQIQTILNNLNNCAAIPSNNKTAAFNVAKTMLEYGYAPAFVAGMIANIISEGRTGQFESSNYGDPSKKPDYLVYMDTSYNGENYYLNTYSGKTITEFNVHSVLAMLEDLKTQSSGTWEIGTSRVGFGLGCIQWSFSRTYALVKLYLEVNKNNSSITETQAAEAESIMIIRELSLSYYQNIVVNWKTACSNNLDTSTAAYEAGSRICSGYVLPASEDAPNERGTKAQTIYAAMMS